MRLKDGKSYQDIADHYGVAKQTIFHHLSPLIGDKGELEAFKEYRADILASLQAKVVKSITDDDLQKASLSQKAVGIGVFYDKERLERGQSTGNIAVALGQVDPLDAASARDFISKQALTALGDDADEQ